MQVGAETLDGIIDTVSAVHPLLPLLGLLKADGKLILLGSPPALELPVMPMLAGIYAFHSQSLLFFFPILTHNYW